MVRHLACFPINKLDHMPYSPNIAWVKGVTFPIFWQIRALHSLPFSLLKRMLCAGDMAQRMPLHGSGAPSGQLPSPSGSAVQPQAAAEFQALQTVRARCLPQLCKSSHL